MLEKTTIDPTESDHFVYSHTSPNGKMYIGITKRKPSDRWAGGYAYKGNKAFFADIQKYGWDAFKHEIIAEGLTEKEAKVLEDRLITQHNTLQPSGYNAKLNKGKSAGECDSAEEYVKRKKRFLKSYIRRAYIEYLQTVWPKFTLEEYLLKNVKFASTAPKDVYDYLPILTAEMYEENQQELDDLALDVEDFTRWLEPFYEENKNLIDISGEGCFGAVFHIHKEVFCKQACEIFKENLSKNKLLADVLFTLIGTVRDNKLCGREVFVRLQYLTYKEVEKDIDLKAEITARYMPFRNQMRDGTVYYTGDNSCYDLCVSLFDEITFPIGSSGITFTMNKEVSSAVYELLKVMGAEKITDLINEIICPPKRVYSMKKATPKACR